MWGSAWAPGKHYPGLRPQLHGGQKGLPSQTGETRWDRAHGLHESPPLPPAPPPPPRVAPSGSPCSAPEEGGTVAKPPASSAPPDCLSRRVGRGLSLGQASGKTGPHSGSVGGECWGHLVQRPPCPDEKRGLYWARPGPGRAGRTPPPHGCQGRLRDGSHRELDSGPGGR